MYLSKFLLPTLKETPSEAEIISHKLMIRAGLIRKLSAGIYTYLPLCVKIIKKIENIVREEMDKAGAQELILPILSPAELWQESERWEVYGKELMRFKDRHDRDFALGPTHEEVITDVVRKDIKSYKELPLCLYQIQTKFRDEIRPRFGIMRAREFVMKDGYSFHSSFESLDDYYSLMFETYTKIFQRCGLKFRAVLADSGAIGGKTTHEFMVLADSGESTVLSCPDNDCGYAATVDTAEGIVEDVDSDTISDENLTCEKVYTPGKKTVAEVSEYLKVQPSDLVKTILYKSKNNFYAVLIRGERDINEAKLNNVINDGLIEMTDEKTTKQLTNADVGFAGPVNLPETVIVIADNSVKKMKNFFCGANETDYHYKNVNLKDISINKFADIMLIKKDDKCIKCRKNLTEFKGIEVGQIFKLGTKYSSKLKCLFNDKDGKAKEMVMGCYGIGITRIIAAAIEQNNDENGIIWTKSIAPFSVLVIPLNKKGSKEFDIAEKIYNTLIENGIETLFDDRNVSPGFKFKDADLIGIPVRVIVGKKGLETNSVEISYRSTGEKIKVNISEVLNKI